MRGVTCHLEALERKGYIQRQRGARTIRVLVEAAKDLIGNMGTEVPVVGHVSAGQPVLAAEHIEDTLTIDSRFVKGAKCFALRVRGDSMIEAGILDRDYVIVQQQSTAQDGDIVVALIGDEATVKRFFQGDGYIRLQPENAAMEPLIVNDHEDEVRILGKVVGAVRKI